MSVISYLQRAARRAVHKGPIDVIRYSSHVIRNTIASSYVDLRFGGKLCKDQLSANSNQTDLNPIMHSEWRILRAIFNEIEISNSDVLVDVGCGEGRVINYWLSLNLPNRMIGIEIDPRAAADAGRRYARFRNVQIICADAATVQHEGTIFYLYNPFTGEALKRFAQSLSNHPAKIVLYNYVDLSPFHGKKISFLTSTRDELQYRVAIIES